jgi:hypothetical protein
VKLERCSNETYCLPTTPKLVTGLKASTADIFCDNAAYMQFLFEKFGVSTVDEESSAIVMVIWFSSLFFYNITLKTIFYFFLSIDLSRRRTPLLV